MFLKTLLVAVFLSYSVDDFARVGVSGYRNSYEKSTTRTDGDVVVRTSYQGSSKDLRSFGSGASFHRLWTTPPAAMTNAAFSRTVDEGLETGILPQSASSKPQQSFRRVQLHKASDGSRHHVRVSPKRANPKKVKLGTSDGLVTVKKDLPEPLERLSSNTANRDTLIDSSRKRYVRLNDPVRMPDGEREGGKTGGREDSDFNAFTSSSKRRQLRERNSANTIAPDSLSGTSCGEGFCWCSGTVANCSGHYGKLTYVPRVPANIRSLIFASNRLTSINSSNFFQNVTNLHSLDLHSNGLKYIAHDAFGAMANLSELWLYGNYELDIAQIGAAVFSVKTLVNLSLSQTNASHLASDTFFRFPLPRLERLYLQSIHLRPTWNATAFQPLLKLKYLGLANNQISYIHTAAMGGNFEDLSALNLEHNFLQHFPKSCYYRRSIYPALERLDLYGNGIQTLPKNVCLPKLKILDLSWNRIKRLSTGMFGVSRFPSLHSLILEDLRPVEKIEAFAFNNTSLKTFSFMYNNLNFESDTVHVDSFKGLTSLTTLQLGHNYLSNVRLSRLLSSCTALEYLYLGNTDLDEITANTLAQFPKLVQISLQRNRLSSLPAGVFDSLKQLRRVDLSNCQLTIISEDTFGSETQRRLQHLDLSGNPFDCSCELLWFRGWLASGDPVFANSYSNYTCWNLPHTYVAQFRMIEQVCLMSRDACKLTVTVVTLLILVLALVAVIFRYRWHIRLLLYEAFRGKGQRLRPPANYFRYDVFVSYAEEDILWVRQHLIPELEDGLGLRLCIHQRDFLPGANIVDNIINSVVGSRKVMMVFSRYFARSQWCQFELACCLSYVMHNDDALVIACVDDVTSGSDLTPTMMAVLYTTTYIQWADEPDAMASFWGRLSIALGEIIPRRNSNRRVDNNV